MTFSSPRPRSAGKVADQLVEHRVLDPLQAQQERVVPRRAGAGDAPVDEHHRACTVAGAHQDVVVAQVAVDDVVTVGVLHQAVVGRPQRTEALTHPGREYVGRQCGYLAPRLAEPEQAVAAGGDAEAGPEARELVAEQPGRLDHPLDVLRRRGVGVPARDILEQERHPLAGLVVRVQEPGPQRVVVQVVEDGDLVAEHVRGHRVQLGSDRLHEGAPAVLGDHARRTARGHAADLLLDADDGRAEGRVDPRPHPIGDLGVGEPDTDGTRGCAAHDHPRRLASQDQVVSAYQP